MLSARKTTSSTMAARDHANNSMIKNNQALQSEYMKKQDQSLAILADGVDRLDDMAKGINDEIRQQDAYGMNELKDDDDDDESYESINHYNHANPPLVCWTLWIRM